MELLFWCLDAKIQHIPPLASLIRMLVRHMHKNVKKKKNPSLSFTVHTRQLFSHPDFLRKQTPPPRKIQKKIRTFQKSLFSLYEQAKTFPSFSLLSYLYSSSSSRSKQKRPLSFSIQISSLFACGSLGHLQWVATIPILSKKRRSIPSRWVSRFSIPVFFEFRRSNLILWIRECIGLWIRRILLLFLLKLFVDLDFVIRSGAVFKFLIRNVIQNFK